MLIDKIKLMLLLEKRKQIIRSGIEGFDTVLTGVFYILSLFCSDFHDFLGINHIVLETIAWIIGIVVTGYGIYKIVRSLRNRYSHERLLNEIENLNEISHKFSLAIIKDTFNEFPNRFLLYYDKSWECWFFFSFPTSDVQNEASILQRISNKLKIDANKLAVSYVTNRIQPKFSEKDKINKVYLHDLYYVLVDSFPAEVQKDSFEIDGTQYKWMTLDEMENDSRIRQINGDVVTFVKEKIG